MSYPQTASDTPKIGRPRSVRAHQAIMQTALRLAHERGYGNVTLQEIATAAGVGRQTIYRWWQNKADLYLDLLIQEIDVRLAQVPAQQQNTLLSYLESAYSALQGNEHVYVEILLELKHDPKKQDTVLLRAVGQRRTLVRRLLQELADLRHTEFVAPLDVVTDMVIGLMWYRVIFQASPVTPNLAHDVHRAVVGLLK
jgi:AcrR family transcriptional regulator